MANLSDSLALRDALGGAAVGAGIRLHNEANEFQDPREEAALERCGAQGVELALCTAERNDGLPSAVRLQLATARLDDAARDALALRVRRGPARVTPKPKFDDQVTLSFSFCGNQIRRLGCPCMYLATRTNVEQAAHTTAIKTMLFRRHRFAIVLSWR
jgi:hypothetical protein